MKKKLLVIDDDPDILKVLKANLELYGFSTVTAENWTAAKEMFDVSIPELVLLDLMLPDGDGMEICRHLKKNYPKMPVIMLTARDGLSDKVLGLESGADDYMVKPFETLELIARIKVCLRRTAPSDTRITIDELEIDLNARSVTIRGKEVELTPKEYDLLNLLISSRGEVVNREFIRKKVWGNAKLYSWSRAIDVHIQHLRQKLEKNPAEPEYILTVSGIGYRFKS